MLEKPVLGTIATVKMTAISVSYELIEMRARLRFMPSVSWVEVKRFMFSAASVCWEYIKPNIFALDLRVEFNLRSL